ncbi:MAG: hypothetical protein J6336_07510, partial [Kiritimatiellae bacterium]|nr:hypothetical protein [Kiritimatiellia bacterium]
FGFRQIGSPNAIRRAQHKNKKDRAQFHASSVSQTVKDGQAILKEYEKRGMGNGATLNTQRSTLNG